MEGELVADVRSATNSEGELLVSSQDHLKLPKHTASCYRAMLKMPYSSLSE